MARLFVAVWPTAPVIEQLRALPRPDHSDVRWASPESWHVTLRFLGEVEPPEVQARLAGARLPAATAVFGPAVHRLGKRTLVVPVGGLDELAAAVGEATADIGEPGRPVPFTGHLTLARLRTGATRGLTGTPISAEVRVEEVVLVRSDLGRAGATYEVIGRWATAL